MKNNEEIRKELMGIAPRLASLNKTNRYIVPVNYFAEFNRVMAEKVRISEVKQELSTIAPELANLNKLKEVATPQGYFSTFSSDLLSTVRAADVMVELKEAAPVLSSVEKVNAFEAPANYFRTLPSQFLNAVKTERSVVSRGAQRSWVESLNNVLDSVGAAIFKPQYTIALAAVTSVLLVGLFMFIHNPNSTDINIAGLTQEEQVLFASLSNEDIDAYFGTHSDELGKSVLDISTDDKNLQKRNDKGELSFENYIQEGVSDEELNNAILE